MASPGGLLEPPGGRSIYAWPVVAPWDLANEANNLTPVSVPPAVHSAYRERMELAAAINKAAVEYKAADDKVAAADKHWAAWQAALRAGCLYGTSIGRWFIA